LIQKSTCWDSIVSNSNYTDFYGDFFNSIVEEQIQRKDHPEPHNHVNEQIVWMLKGKLEFRLGSEHGVCGRGDVVVIPAGAEHEAWVHEDTEVIDFFAPARDDFLPAADPPT
jgi:quercetin dioxygenase-like cupin family protein